MSLKPIQFLEAHEETGGNTGSENDELVCRICHDADKKEPLVSPCDCKGSLGLVHLTCLHRWLLEAHRTRCEVCGASFEVRRRLRRHVLRSLRAWCCVPRACTRPRLLWRGRRRRRALAADIVVGLTSGVMLVGATWACLQLTDHYSLRASRASTNARRGESPSVIMVGAQVIATILILLMCGSVICFSWWAIGTLRKQAQIWYFWWQHDVMLMVVAEPVNISAYKRGWREIRGAGVAVRVSERQTTTTSATSHLPDDSGDSGSCRGTTEWEDGIRTFSEFSVEEVTATSPDFSSREQLPP